MIADTNAAALAAMREIGLIVDAIEFTGQLVRCPVDGKPHGKDGAYMAYGDHPASVWAMNWRTGESRTWTAKSEKHFTPAERKAFNRRIEETRRMREEEKKQRHDETGRKAQAIYEKAEPCTEHPYLTRKGVSPCSGLKVHKSGALVAPLFDEFRKISTLQFINDDGTKRFLSGGKKQGSFFPIGGKDASLPLAICEGLATGISLHQATQFPCLCSFDAGNMLHVAAMARAIYPERCIIICADDDHKTTENPGLTKATEAALGVGGCLAVPVFGDNRPDGVTDFNDLHQLRGLEAVQDTIQKAIAAGPIAPNPLPDTLEGNRSLPVGYGHATQNNDEETIARLAGLPPLEYERVREKEAERLGIRVSALDKLVNYERRGNQTADGIDFDHVTPWPEPVNGEELLSDITKIIQRFIVCDTAIAYAAALWVAMTWLIDSVQVAPLAVITSPEKRCGKSQLLAILGKLSRRPLMASNISPAALYRVIELWSPTLVIDEADAFMRDNEELRGVLNGGHTRDSAYVIRNAGDDYTPKQFNTWGAKAIAGIGKLADTLMDRAIVFDLRRKRTNEEVDRLRYAEPGLFDDLASRLYRFAEDSCEAVRKSRPELPRELNDRAQDNWEPLIAIADVAGGIWPAAARQVAKTISGNADDAASVNSELLADIKEIFETKGIDKISTKELLEALCKDDEKSWATYNRGKEFTSRQLANRLRGYGIKSKNCRSGYSIIKGYERWQFNDAFDRYIPS